MLRTYSWVGDGMATAHFSPFLADNEWTATYRRMQSGWMGEGVDPRWRMWILTCCAKQAEHLRGTFVEFGTYRAGCAYMALSATERTSMWLYDTFEGIPETNLTATEEMHGFGGRLGDTSVEHVKAFLAPWADRIRIVAGDVFDTVPAYDPGAISLAHMDLNASAPTGHVLPFCYERLVQGGLLLFDDYGWAGYEDQRAIIHEFFRLHAEHLIALPTGQALVVKH